MKKHNFKNLQVWQKAKVLIKEIYQITRTFPDDERFGLISQLRRASISVMANLAEGSGRKTSKDLGHFTTMSYGSALEIESLLIASLDLGYLNDDEYSNLEERINEVQRMLNGLGKSIK
ncbi:four helix bundle protein [Bacteroidia bacterium]|nr:four helix bundle protein [Bacteroidia bacterium]